MLRLTSLQRRSRRVAVGAGLATLLAATVAVPASSAGAAPQSGSQAAASTVSSAAAGRGLHTYRVVITNLMSGQPLSPPVLTTNFGSGEIFRPGRKANWGVQQVAENGSSDALYAGLKQDQKAGYVTDVVRASTPLLLPKATPGGKMFPQSVALTIRAKPGQRLNLISMIGCSNDGFVGFDAARLPAAKGRTINVRVRDYDAGTEENTEDFADLTAACQGAIGVSSQFGAAGTSFTNWRLAENGTVQRHEGVFDTSDDGLRSEVHGWDPRRTARVLVTRVA